MKMEVLARLGPANWPPDAAEDVLATLRDRTASPSERLLAAEIAGNVVLMNDRLAEELLRIFADAEEPEDLRGSAAIAFGPALEEWALELFDDEESELVSWVLIERAQAMFRDAYRDPATPKDLRRRALEASVRAPQPWHEASVRAAFYDRDPAWRLTSVYCMRYVEGFDDEILQAMESEDPDILFEAIYASTMFCIGEAWPRIEAMIRTAESGQLILPEFPDAQRGLVLAAIEAAAERLPLKDLPDLIGGLTESDDPEVAETALDFVCAAQAAMAEEDEAGAPPEGWW